MIYKKDVIPSETFLKEQVLLKGTWKMISFIQESGQKCFALHEWHEGDVKIMRVLKAIKLELESPKNSGWYVYAIDIISVSPTVC